MPTAVFTRRAASAAFMARRGSAEFIGDIRLPSIGFLTATGQVAEGATLPLDLSLSIPLALDTQVTVTVTGGDASEGTDFTVDGVVGWTAGQSGAPTTGDLEALSDLDLDPNETVEITISNPTNGAVLGAITVKTITILETAPGVALLEVTTGAALTEVGGGYILEV